MGDQGAGIFGPPFDEHDGGVVGKPLSVFGEQAVNEAAQGGVIARYSRPTALLVP